MALIVHSSPLPEGSSGVLSLVLVDESGLAMQEALTSLSLTYYDQYSETIINNRSSQDVLNTNDCTFGLESLGTPTLTFISTSKIIRRATGNWLNGGVAVGSQVLISGTALNNGTFSVTKVSATDLTVSESVVGEVAIVSTVGVPGKITWAMTPLDTVLVDQRKERETHIALLVWTWSGGAKSGSQEISLIVENLSLYP